MARRRKARVRTVRSVSRSPFKRRSRGKSGSSKIQLFQPDAMAYGAVRGYTSDLLTNMLPNTILGQVGGLADEAVMGVANWFIAKNTSGFIQKVALKGLTIENARVGEAVASMAFGNTSVQKSGIKII